MKSITNKTKKVSKHKLLSIFHLSIDRMQQILLVLVLVCLTACEQQSSDRLGTNCAENDQQNQIHQHLYGKQLLSCSFLDYMLIAYATTNPDAPVAGTGDSSGGTGDFFVQDAYIKAANSSTDDRMGQAVAIDGSFVVVGVQHEENLSTSINNTDNPDAFSDVSTASGVGAVYVYRRPLIDTNILTDNGFPVKEGDYYHEAYLKPSNAGAGDLFGFSVDISNPYIIVGAMQEDNGSTTINNTDNPGNFADASTANNSGAAYIFKYDNSSGNYIQDAYLKASNASASDFFGASVAIQGDYAVVGAPDEDNGVTEINNTDGAPSTTNNLAGTSGAVYVFKREAGTGNWIQDAYLKGSNTGANDRFGVSVGITSCCGTLMRIAVGAPTEGNASTTIVNEDNASITDTGTDTNVGAVYVFKPVVSGGNWVQDAYLKASNAGAGDLFGTSVAVTNLTSGTTRVVVGAPDEDNSSTFIDNTDNSTITDVSNFSNAGAAYVFKLEAETGIWKQDAYLKASNSGPNDKFGTAVAVDGINVVVGAPNEDNGTRNTYNNDNSLIPEAEIINNSGALYIFRSK